MISRVQVLMEDLGRDFISNLNTCIELLLLWDLRFGIVSALDVNRKKSNSTGAYDQPECRCHFRMEKQLVFVWHVSLDRISVCRL